MGRHPLHSQSFHYRASLHFSAWSAASAPASLPAACQAPGQTLACAGGRAMPGAGSSTFLASAARICQGLESCRELTRPPFSLLSQSATPEAADRMASCSSVRELRTGK